MLVKHLYHKKGKKGSVEFITYITYAPGYSILDMLCTVILLSSGLCKLLEESSLYSLIRYLMHFAKSQQI